MNDKITEVLTALTTQIDIIKLSLADLKPGIERFINNLDTFSDKLIQLGWTVNMNMMPYHINEISEAIDKCDLDNYYYNFFMDNNQSEFIYLKNRCMEQLDIGLVGAFDECLFAFSNQKYIICINTLIAILEGVLSKYSTDKTITRIIKLCKKQVELIPEEQEINRVIWYVNLKFVERLYHNVPFSEMEPSNLNRHWLLHGRSMYDIEEIDCLRIMNSIGTLCDVSTKP